MSKIATLAEIKTTWSIDDLLDAHEMLDLKELADLSAASGEE